MFLETVFLGIFGFVFGIAVAAGAFALVVVLRIIPRLVGKSKTAYWILHYEQMVMLGAIVGNILSVFYFIPIPGGSFVLWLYGIGSGIYVGCLAMALAEIMNVFPLLTLCFAIRECKFNAFISIVYMINIHYDRRMFAFPSLSLVGIIQYRKTIDINRLWCSKYFHEWCFHISTFFLYIRKNQIY